MLYWTLLIKNTIPILFDSHCFHISLLLICDDYQKFTKICFQFLAQVCHQEEQWFHRVHHQILK